MTRIRIKKNVITRITPIDIGSGFSDEVTKSESSESIPKK
jgi:hypothetical protein